MISNLFSRFKKSTWDIPNLIQALEYNSAGKSNLLSKLVQTNSLCETNKSKSRFIVIKQFASRENANTIQIINKKPFKNSGFFPNSHIGMTLVSISADSALEFSVILPNKLSYSKVELCKNNTIKIYSSLGITQTNFEEIKCLWNIKEYPENEILKKFKNLKNEIGLVTEHKISNTGFITDAFFGKLLLDKELDTYTIIYQYNNHDINMQLSNTIDVDLLKNLSTLKSRIKELALYETQMTKELLKLKNDLWLKESQENLSLGDFKKEIRITDVTMHIDGSLEIYYQAKDLFLGHEIISNINSKGEYEESNLIG